jgi:hypothetical protein
VAFDSFSLADIPIITNFLVIPQIAERAVNFALSHENIAPIMKEKFDAVIVEIFMTEALYGMWDIFIVLFISFLINFAI